VGIRPGAGTFQKLALVPEASQGTALRKVIDPLPVRPIGLPLSLITVTVGEGGLTAAVSPVGHPLALISRPIGKDRLPLPFTSALSPLADVLLAVGEEQFAEAVETAAVYVSRIKGSIGVEHDRG